MGKCLLSVKFKSEKNYSKTTHNMNIFEQPMKFRRFSSNHIEDLSACFLSRDLGIWKIAIFVCIFIVRMHMQGYGSFKCCITMHMHSYFIFHNDAYARISLTVCLLLWLMLMMMIGLDDPISSGSRTGSRTGSKL